MRQRQAPNASRPLFEHALRKTSAPRPQRRARKRGSRTAARASERTRSQYRQDISPKHRPFGRTRARLSAAGIGASTRCDPFDLVDGVFADLGHRWEWGATTIVDQVEAQGLAER